MSNTIIKVENLSKKYQIGSRESYYSLRDKISGIFDFKNKEKKEKGEFWALKDVNFEVKQGESIGIIGRNGAGKSTLLKVLSQITPPTTGKITMKGRVASLLEVGTGFNPELTGRENIFLNGAILGMTREEIKRKFDEIVAFAEIEKFLDTPVKRYSSGMYMRLAFSVAAHLESEILIVDEVLAVGDAQFQKKCLGKMNDVTKNEGRTVLFVSHNMGAIEQLCTKGVLLEKGELKAFGSAIQVIGKYMSSKDVFEEKNIGIKIYTSIKNPEIKWGVNKNIIIDLSWKKGLLKSGWECDLAFYNIDGIKLFAIQSGLIENFDNQIDTNGMKFLVTNPGFSEKIIRIDIGIREKKNEPYKYKFENCIFVNPYTIGVNPYVYEKINEGVLYPHVICEMK